MFSGVIDNSISQRCNRVKNRILKEEIMKINDTVKMALLFLIITTIGWTLVFWGINWFIDRIC